MKTVYKDKNYMSKEELSLFVKKNEQFLTDTNEDVSTDMKKYFRDIKKEAFRRGICPKCGFDLAWGYKVVHSSDPEVVGLLKCHNCGYKGVIK